ERVPSCRGGRRCCRRAGRGGRAHLVDFAVTRQQHGRTSTEDKSGTCRASGAYSGRQDDEVATAKPQKKRPVASGPSTRSNLNSAVSMRTLKLASRSGH